MTDHLDLPVVATGDWIDAAWINQYLRDNFNAIFQGMAAGGDIPYAVDANTVGALAIGAAGGVLTSSGSAPQWLAKPASVGLLKNDATGTPSYLTGGSKLQILRKNYGDTDIEWGSLVLRRQGGSATVWTQPGTTAYTPTGANIQTGYVSITVSSGGTNYADIPYVTAFSQRPAIFLTTEQTGSLSTTWALGHTDDTTSGFRLHLKFTSTSQTGTYTVGWMAIGES